MEPNLPSPTRRWAGALALPLVFVALIVATLADPVEDSASAGDQLKQAAGHLGRLQLTFLAELTAAGLFIAAVMTVVGMVRGRGAGLANTGGVVGILGGVGLALIGTSHVYLYALTASGTGDAARVLAARDAVAGGIVVLFFAAPLAVVLLCAAVVRSGAVAWPLLVVAGAFLVLEFVPTPAGELPALVAGLVAFGWIGLARITDGRAAETGAVRSGVRSGDAVPAA
jgi:hypothetical protein